jgi:hypothetical protein
MIGFWCYISREIANTMSERTKREILKEEILRWVVLLLH